MGIKKFKPTTPSRRRMSVISSADLTKGLKPLKSMIASKKSVAGRNSEGRITVRHRGGGAKRLYRMIDFTRSRFDMPAEVIAIEYDPNRGPRIALIQYEDEKKAYILAGEGMKVGTKVLSSQKAIEAVNGARMPLEHIPSGMFVYNVELQPTKGGQVVRGAGAGAQIQVIEGKYAQLKLPSGEIRLFLKECMGTVGRVGNSDYQLVRLGKAGRRRHLGWRPTVKGKNMNPVDHPHGGGEGHSPIGLKVGPKTPWGKKARGVKTRKKGKWNDKLIVQRRKRKKR